MTRRTAILSAGLAPFLVPAVRGDGPKIRPEQVIKLEEQDISVPDFQADGYVLDIGGGGEGIIGLLKPKQVVAIDLFKRELEDAPAGPLKIVMDARDLKFLDNTFQTATSFFTLMYVPETDHAKVFSELYRVIAPGGRFMIWDAAVQPKFGEKEWTVFQLRVLLPGREVKTGYGVPMGTVVHDTTYYCGMAEKTGFRAGERRAMGKFFYLELRKPA